MVEKGHGEAVMQPAPCVLFMGDFNVGKSSLINALMRREALYASREESRALPTFVARTDRAEAHFSAYRPDPHRIDEKGQDEFFDIRQDRNNDAGYVAMGARFPAAPFLNLVLIDTAGASSDSCETIDISHLAAPDEAMLVVVTDIEYWAARHTLDFVRSHLPVFGGALVLVANKADHLNASEIRRITDKAPDRLRAYGIDPAPRFFAVSARLEFARHTPRNEYRHRTRREVRELCDASFDAFRVALYEFEASRAIPNGTPTFRQLFESPVIASFLKTQGTAVV
ncbi:MAG: 50S ribosome-binding GTPase [Candidatus Hydrogenedentes bacterium]|nr:50S ribosome-binding GTPase [Candidatus Hydrogenedentota bacterium]